MKFLKTTFILLIAINSLFNSINAQSVSFKNTVVNISQWESEKETIQKPINKNKNFSCAIGCSSSTGPNLVPNSDLETPNPIICNNPGINGELFLDLSSIANWIGGTLSNGPNAGITPDYWANCAGNPAPPSPGCSGQALGFFTTAPNAQDVLEWVQVQLTQPLVAGKQYCLSFEAFSNSGFPFVQADGLSVLALPNQLNLDNVIANGGTFPTGLAYEHPSGDLIPTTCTNFNTIFTAAGNEQWIAFGNIDPNTTILDGGGQFSASYIVIDNVSLAEITGGGGGLNVTATQVGSPSCGGNGSATASTNGGTAPFSYLWDNGETTQTATNLSSGTHTVTLTDASGCVGTASVNIIIGSTTISISVNQVSGVECIGDSNGSANVTANSGTPPFSYAWDNGETTTTAIALNAGTHTVSVTDSGGCSATGSVTITSPSQISITLLGSSGGCNALCNKSASISVTGGVPPYGYLWSNNESTPNPTALCPGVNTVSVSDNNGCIQTFSVTINSAAFAAEIIQDSILRCNSDCNAILSVMTTGGVPPYQYTWNTGGTGPSINSLCIGSYYLSISDANGCSVIDSIIITQPQKIYVTATTKDAECNLTNGTIDITSAGGVPGYTYLWDNNSTTTSITGLAMGTYTVTVSDNNQCCSIVSLILGMDDCCTTSSNPCVDAIQGTIDICTEINANPNIPLATIDCDGDGVTNADECTDTTDPLDPCDFVDTSISLPVIADQSGCPQPCPDLSPIVTVLPGNLAGSSPIEVAVRVSEVDGVDTDGTVISLRIPSDPRLLFVWSISLTQSAGVQVDNSDWNYLGDNGVFHNWTYNGPGLVINGGSSSAIGFQGFYDPQGTDGQTTVTATIVPLSGGDCNIFNNSDSERIVYFK